MGSRQAGVRRVESRCSGELSISGSNSLAMVVASIASTGGKSEASQRSAPSAERFPGARGPQGGERMRNAWQSGEERISPMD